MSSVPLHPCAARAAQLGLLLALAAPGSARAQAFEIEARDRVPLAFLLVSPSGEAAQVRSSVVIDLVSKVVENHTDFAVNIVDAARVADCDGRLPCLVRAVRDDYDRARLTRPDGSVVPYAEHRAQLEASGTRVPEALLVLSSLAFGGKDRLVPQWIDTDEALAIAHEADRSAPSWERDVEARVREYAVPVELRSGVVTSEDDARAFVEAMITTRLRPELERRGHWEPFGQVRLSEAPEGAALRLDGRTVGTTRSGEVILLGVRPGRRTLELDRPGFDPWSVQIDVRRGQEIRLQAELQARGSGTHPGRSVVFWGGLAVGAAGAALGVVALAAQPSDTVTYCPPPCGDRFLVLGEDTTTTPVVNGAPSGVLAGPLGYALALTGATWSIGSLLEGDDGDFPWWSTLGGLVLGGAAYAVSAAADPGS